MTTESILLITLLAIPGVIIILMLLIDYEAHIPEYMEDDLLRTFSKQVAAEKINKRVNFSDFSILPAPVERYLKNALTDGQPLISIVKVKQMGKLRKKARAINGMHLQQNN